jgi:hypothetical protein
MRKWAGHRRLAVHVGRIGGPTDLRLREWMLGLPIGWTAIEALETAKFQQWQQQHFVYSARACDQLENPS